LSSKTEANASELSTGACVGHLDNDSVEHYLNVTETGRTGAGTGSTPWDYDRLAEPITPGAMSYRNRDEIPAPRLYYSRREGIAWTRRRQHGRAS
jgi:hypothetical protein